MRRSSAILTLIIFCALAVLAQNNVQVFIEGKVVRVADGDTITVLDNQNQQHRIRFQGIDAPESKQAFGQRSKQNLSDLVFGKQVTVIYSKMDKYRRVVGKVLLDGKDVNIEQIKAGLAWHYKKYEDEQPPEDRVSYAKAEQEARAAKRGLWAEPNPTPPGEYRQKVKLDRWGAPPPEGTVIGNKNSKKYHRPDCPGYRDMAERNRVFFKTAAEAEAAGYKRAGNCPPENMMSKTVAQSAPVAAKSTPATASDEDADEEEESSSATVKADPVTLQSDNRPMPVDKPHPGSEKEGASEGSVIGNKNSKKYHLTNCPGYKQVSEKNRVTFKSAEEAEAAGYTRASNCQPGETTSKTTVKSTPASETKSVDDDNNGVKQTSTVTPEPSAASTAPVSASSNVAEPIIGNRNSKIYHKPGCPGYKSVSEKNQIKFNSAAEAEAAGFTVAKNCKK